MEGLDGFRQKLLVALVALALLPMTCIGILSLMEMNRASEDVQNNITSLSTSLNRSALAVGPDEADQVQLAIAKARQYDQFFLHIAAENEIVAKYAASSSADESCDTPSGIWVAPTGSDQIVSEKRDATVKSLCSPARIMQEFRKAESSLYLSYIGTEDGVLAVWPYSNKTLSNAAPFSYKDMPYYSQAKQMKKTIWTGPYVDGKGDDLITVTTPFFRNNEFAGIAGMDVSLYPIFSDLSTLKGRGYPFIIDSSGLVVYRPRNKPESDLKDLFASDNLLESADPDVKALAKSMLKDDSGFIVVGLGKGDEDGYVAFSRIDSMGWFLCIAYDAEEMSLPARYIDSGIRDVAKRATAGLDDATQRVREYVLIIFFITGLSVLAAGWWLAEKIDGQLNSFIRAAERISRGEFDVEVSAGGVLGDLGATFNKMARAIRDIRDHAEKQKEAPVFEGGSGKEGPDKKEPDKKEQDKGLAFLEDVKGVLAPAITPQVGGYEIRTLHWSSECDSFDIYDVLEADGKIAFAMASVGGDGVQAAILAIMSRTLIRASPDRLDPAMAIGSLNSQINQHGRGTNLAAFYAILDPINHTLEYVNAGFNPPFIVDPGGMVDTLGGGGVALGMLDRVNLETTLIPIQTGDVLVMYSNGVVEAKDGHNASFGIGRLINLVITNRDRPASEIQLAVEKDLMDHTEAGAAASDVSLIILKRI